MVINRQRWKKVVFSLAVSGFVLLMLNEPCCAESPSALLFSEGETITYKIKKFGLGVGKATLTFNGLVSIEGRTALEIILTAKGFRFFDEERIYLDAQTFSPLVIKRDLNIFGIKEKINEFYDSELGKVRIVKTAKGETTEQVIENGARFDNIYGFIYRYRQRGQFQMGEEFHLHLPTRDVTFKLVEHSLLNVAGQELEAYYMDSVPKQYKVWFDSSSKKIPLMIDGAIGFGHTSMIMEGYVASAQ